MCGKEVGASRIPDARQHQLNPNPWTPRDWCFTLVAPSVGSADTSPAPQGRKRGTIARFLLPLAGKTGEQSEPDGAHLHV